ncbi:fungal-specific transcription factor domain-containing protein [Exophiala viscosa]|uniref:Fungal-specific transcription factor domain-containing protein n=1 Tax=Exophiala viscosa TaxID=2486360 RepID=A0AAN6DZ12_9EURO|nr:fungal-specific transcription factor domain-containing protein [Exophiala viscosa]
MQLSWQPGFSTHRKPVKKSIVRRSRWEGSGDSSRPRQLEFIAEYPSDLTEPNGPTIAATDSSTPILVVHGAEYDEPLTTNNIPLRPSPFGVAASQDDTVTGEADLSVLDESLLFDTEDIPLLLNGTDAGAKSRPARNNAAEDKSQWTPPSNKHLTYQYMPNEYADDFDDFDGILTPLGLSTLSHRDLRPLPYHFVDAIPPNVLYESPFERLGPIFERYNNEFSIIPLTLDLPMNPFRYRTEALQKSGYLLHAVLALSCHHTNKLSLSSKGDQPSEKVLDHGRTALQLFRQALNSDNIARMSSSLLDTIVILFSLDEAYSLFGSWTTHLSGAYSILELGGGVEVWTKNPRTVVQVALLTWWDAVISLVNRTPCVFPYEYFVSVLACCDDQFWTFFGLCGCPQSLAVPLVQLAHLAAEKQKTASMRWVLFDNSLISEIEQSLEAWNHTPSGTAFDDEESMHQDMDCMHCSEAWRNGLLLYIYRVFRWEPGDTRPVRVLSRARVILDHACACRDDGFVARQALLPLFFAGCEMADLSAQNRIRALCSAWNERTRYHMFGGMVPLLEEVWKAQMALGPQNVWWGQIVDDKAAAKSQNSLQMRICFG